MTMVPPAAEFAPVAPDFETRWHALEAAAGVIASLAGEPAAASAVPVPDRLAGPHCQLAEQALIDLGAMLEPGIAALLEAHRRGAAVEIPAGVLWDEFRAARDGLVEMIAKGPR